MVTVGQTVINIVDAPSWDARVAQIRLIAQRHGTGEHPQIYANVARRLYVPHLAPTFAYVHDFEPYERSVFLVAYGFAEEGTNGFTNVTDTALVNTLQEHPESLLVFRTATGLTTSELAESTRLVAESAGLAPISSGKVGSCERKGTQLSYDQANVLARTLNAIMDGSLFGEAPSVDLKAKQQKLLDARHGWSSAASLAANRVSYADYLHQRHFGGSFRQLLDATSSKRGDLLEDAVEALFAEHGVSFVRTGSHDQRAIESRFEILVTPAPDFVVFDDSGLRAMLECKLVNDGGTARDKALRFERLRAEARRLGGIPLFAVLSGLGWTRVNDTLGPVVRDCDGRVFTLSTLPEMMSVAPFPSLNG